MKIGTKSSDINVYTAKTRGDELGPLSTADGKTANSLKIHGFLSSVTGDSPRILCAMPLPAEEGLFKHLAQNGGRNRSETATSAFEQALDQGVSDPDSIWLTFTG